MKILYIGTGDFPGGGAAGRCMHMVAKGLVNQGHGVTVLMGRRRRPGPSLEIIDGIEVIWTADMLPGSCNTKVSKLLYVAKTRFLFAKELIRLASSRKYSWIISYAVGLEVLIPIVIARSLYRLHIASQYGDLIHTDFKAGFIGTISFKLGQSWGIKTSDIILNSGSKDLENHFKKIAPKAKVIQLLPPVDTGIFRSADETKIRNRFGLHDLKVVTYIGGFKPFEGLVDLVHALTATLNSHKDTRLIIAGGMVESDFLALQEVVAALPCKEQILLPGQLSLEDVTNLLAASYVVVLPKTDHPVNHHAMPIKLGEYFASGKPVVSSAVGGIVDYLRHNINGLIYKPGDLEALRMNVEELLLNPEKAKTLGLAGQQTALEQFDINIVAATLIEALKEVSGNVQK